MEFLLHNWMLIAVALVSGGMLVWPLAQRRLSPMKELGTLELTRLINSRNALVLDVRETNEYQGGHIPNATHVPLSQLGARAGELAKQASRPVVAYCERGNRSRMAGGPLARAGFKEVYHLGGGIKSWRDAGLPVEK